MFPTDLLRVSNLVLGFINGTNGPKGSLSSSSLLQQQGFQLTLNPHPQQQPSGREHLVACQTKVVTGQDLFLNRAHVMSSMMLETRYMSTSCKMAPFRSPCPNGDIILDSDKSSLMTLPACLDLRLKWAQVEGHLLHSFTKTAALYIRLG